MCTFVGDPDAPGADRIARSPPSSSCGFGLSRVYEPPAGPAGHDALAWHQPDSEEPSRAMLTNARLWNAPKLARSALQLSKRHIRGGRDSTTTVKRTESWCYPKKSFSDLGVAVSVALADLTGQIPRRSNQGLPGRPKTRRSESRPPGPRRGIASEVIDSDRIIVARDELVHGPSIASSKHRT